MDESLVSCSESRLRTIFSSWGGKADSEKAAARRVGPDPLFPNLDAEGDDQDWNPDPGIHKRQRELYRPSWDPRERWQQLRPTPPLHAPPESDLPAQFRYEDLSPWEKSETMDIDQDRLLNWLVERFNRGLQFKYTGELSELTADEAVRFQEFTPLQILDEQLNNLGLSSVDLALHEKRRRLLEGAEAAATAAAAAATDSIQAQAESASTQSTWEQEGDGDGGVEAEFSDFVSPQLQTQHVVTVHEAPRVKQHPRRQPRGLLDCGGDAATGSTIECEVSIRPPPHHPQFHRVEQFGDVPGCEDQAAAAKQQRNGKMRLAEEDWQRTDDRAALIERNGKIRMAEDAV